MKSFTYPICHIQPDLSHSTRFVPKTRFIPSFLTKKMWQIGEFTVYYIQNYVSDHTLCIWELLGRKIFLNLVSSYQVHQKFRYSPNHNFDWIQYRKNPIFRGSRPCQNSLFAGEGPRCSSDCCFQNHRQMGDSYRLFQSLENLFLVMNSKIF